MVLLVQNRAGLPEPVRAAGARLARTTSARGQAVVKWEWLRELQRRPDRAVGRAGRRRSARRCCTATTPRARGARAAARRRCFRTASTSSCSAPACPTTRRTCAPRCSWPRACSCRWWRRTRCSSSTPDDYEAHEARVCIAEGEMLGNPRRVKRFTREQYFKTQAQMEALFADLPSALANTVEIAKRCNLTLVLGKPQLPDFPTPLVDGGRMPMAEYFRIASHEGLEERLAQLYPDEAERERERPRYVERLEFEIETILKMGFPGYFLIVGDFINWAKNNGCPVGPGRGSGAGSLVAYCAQDHRPRSAAVQPAVRALPEPGAGVDARLRHRLLPGQPRPRDRLREGQVRPRRGQPDRDLRHDGREGGAARRRPRAGHELRPRRRRSPS